MNKSKEILLSLISIFLVVIIFESPAEIIPIDLNTFFVDPSSSVVVTPDGRSATLNEDLLIAPILLSNDPALGDPGLGDPNIIFGGPVAFLSFDYTFAEGVANEDEFFAFVLTESGNGGSAGPAFEFLTQESGSGSVKFDIMPLASENLGLQFQLDSFDTLIGSSLTISNVTIATPEPGTVSLFVILGVIIITFRYYREKKGKHDILSKDNCVN